MSYELLRQRTYAKQAVIQRVLIYKLKDQLDVSVQLAIDKGLSQASIWISEDLDSDLVNALQRVLIKLGYHTTIEYSQGRNDSNVLIFPRAKLTISWGK